MNLKINKIKSFKKFYIITCYLLCWLSISTTFNDLLFLQNLIESKIFHFNKMINFLRHSLIYLIFLSSIYFLLFSIIENKISFKKNLIFIILIIYFLLQIPGLILTNNSAENISFIISSLALISVLILSNTILDYKERQYLINITTLILLTVLLLTFFPKFLEFMKGVDKMYGGNQLSSELFLSKSSPRSSGLSRSALILIILMTIYSYKKKFFIQNFYNIIVFLLVAIISLYMSRVILFLSIFVLLYIFYLIEDKTLKNFVSFSVKFFLLPSLITVSLFYIHAMKKQTRENYDYIKKEKYTTEINSNIELYKQEKILNLDKHIRHFSLENFSSGRAEDWMQIFTKIKDTKIFLGYGAQGDRYLINQSASNGLIYAYSSSGLIGLLFFMYFSLIVFKKSLKILFNNNIEKEFKLHALIVIVLLLRSILETSYAVFSIDFIVLITSLSFYSNINDNKKDQ